MRQTFARTMLVFIAAALLAAVGILLSMPPAKADPSCVANAATIDDVVAELERLDSGGKAGKVVFVLRSGEGMSTIYSVAETAATAALFVFEGRCLVSADPGLDPDRIARVVFGKPSRAAMFAPEKES